MKEIIADGAGGMKAAVAEFEALLGEPNFKCACIPRKDAVYCVCDIVFHDWIKSMSFNLRMIASAVTMLLPACEYKNSIFRAMGTVIGENVSISPGVFIDPFFPELITLESGCFLGTGCRIMTHEFTANEFRFGSVRIGTGSVVGAWSTVRSGVTVGKRATTGFMSFVNRDVPDGDTVVGIPAKSIPRRSDMDSGETGKPGSRSLDGLKHRESRSLETKGIKP